MFKHVLQNYVDQTAWSATLDLPKENTPPRYLNMDKWLIEHLPTLNWLNKRLGSNGEHECQHVHTRLKKIK